MPRTRDLLLTSSLVILTAVGEARAQGAFEIEELVVTAEKRAQSLQDVPVAISAYTSETRETLGIISVQDLTYFTPGMQYSNSQDRVSVRGIGRLTDNLATEGGVAIYYDGIYTSSTAEAGRSPLFVERTEVLRGPQGTLYGRNSIGGAINIISKRPAREFGGEVRASLANFGRREFEGRISAPVADNLRLSLGASKVDQEDGYFRNYSGLPDEGGVTDAFYVEAQAQAELGESVELWLRYSFQQADSRARFATANGPYDTSSPVTNLFTVPQSAYGFNLPHTQVGTFMSNPGVTDLRGFNTNTVSQQKLKDYHTLTADVTFHMPGVDLRYLGGFRTFYNETFADFDNTPITSYVYPAACVTQTTACLRNFDPRFQGITIFPTYVTNFVTDKQWWSHELNLTSTGEGPLQWILGAYVYGERLYQALHIPSPFQPQFETVRQRDTLSAFTANTLSQYDNSRRDVYYVDQALKNWSNALFAQVDYAIDETWSVTAGVRYTKDVKKAKEQSWQTCWAFPSFICTAAGTINSDGSVTLSDQDRILNNQPVDWQGTLIVPNEALDSVFEDGVLTPAFRHPQTHLITRHLGREWSAMTGTLSLDWTPNEDALVYVRYSRGYKAGGFNSGAGSQAFPTTKPEKVDAYEIGAKLNLGPTVQLNAAAFYYDYTNLQTPVFIIPPGGGPGQTQFFNVPESRSIGLELEAVWRPLQALTLIANYAYLDPVIEKACCFVDTQDPQALQPGAKPAASPVAGGALTGAQIGQDMSDQRLPNSPRHKLVLNGAYRIDLAPGNLVLSATYAWKDETYHSIFNRPYNLSDAYGILDLRATWTDAGDRYAVVAFVRNATDELVVDRVEAGALDNLNNPIRNLYLLDPRTYGVQVQYRF